MASPAAVLSILVKADGVARASGQIKDLDKDLDKANKTGGKTSSAFKKVGAVVGGVVAFETLRRGVGAAVAEFEEARKVGALTESVIKSTGGAAKITAREVGQLAEKISNKTAIDDEAVQSGANLLLTFKNIRNEAGKGRDIFNQATAAAVDLSAAGFGSIESTSKQLGKALNDPVKGMTALGRSGVTFSEDQKKAIEALIATGEASDRVKAQQIILREVQSQVGGAAAAQATPMDRLRVTLANLAEAAGAVLVPAFDKAARFLAEFFGQMMENRGVGGAMISTFKRVGGAIGGVIGAVRSVVGWFEKHETATTALVAATAVLTAAFVAMKVKALVAMIPLLYAQVAAWTALKVAMLTNPFVLTAAAIAALVAVIVIAYRESETFRAIVDALWGAIKTAVGWVASLVAGMAELAPKVFEAGKSITVGLVEGVKALPGDVLAGGKWLVNKVVDGVKSLPGVVKGAADWVKDKYVAYVKALAGAYKNIGGWILGRVVDGLKTVWHGIATVAGWIKDRLFEFARTVGAGYVNIGGWILGQIVDGLKTIWKGIGTVAEWLKDTLRAGVETIADRFVNIGGYILNRIIDGLRDIGEKALNAVKAVKNAIVDAVKDVFKDAISIPFKIKLPKIDLPFGGAGGGMVGPRPSSVDGFNKIAASYGNVVTSGYRPGDDGWHGQNRARDYAGGNMLGFAKFMAANFGKHLLELIHTPLGFGIKNGSTVPLSFWGGDVNADHYDHVHVAMANGGHVARAGWALVGERGPELAHLPTGASVYSNRDSRMMLGGGMSDRLLARIAESLEFGADVPQSMVDRAVYRVVSREFSAGWQGRSATPANATRGVRY